MAKIGNLPDGLGLDQLLDHVAKHCTDCIESLVCVADVRESRLVQEDFLYDEDGDSLGKLGASFHDAETEGDNFCGEKKVDDGGVFRRLWGRRVCGLL